MKKIFFLSLVIGIIWIIITYNHYLNNNIKYRFHLLSTWTTEEKMEAMGYLADKGELSVVPILIENIDNWDRWSWSGEPKGGNITLSCVSTVLLQILIKNQIGNTCYYNKDITNEQIIQNWRNWYKNEYPAWLAEQNKKNEKN